MTKDYFDKMRAERAEFKEASTLLGPALDDLKYAREDADRALAVIKAVEEMRGRLPRPCGSKECTDPTCVSAQKLVDAMDRFRNLTNKRGW